MHSKKLYRPEIGYEIKPDKGHSENCKSPLCKKKAFTSTLSGLFQTHLVLEPIKKVNLSTMDNRDCQIFGGSTAHMYNFNGYDKRGNVLFFSTLVGT